MTPDTFYAHTLGNQPENWERLEIHLQIVQETAGKFADAFDAGEWGKLAGLWHDLGKYSEEFQRYIRASNNADAGEQDQSPGRVDHSTFGAQYAARAYAALPHIGQVLAFCIAGHHAGLTDGTTNDDSVVNSTLEARLTKPIPAANLPAMMPPPKLLLPFKPSPKSLGFEVAFFTRMLFSCLIDADRTCTERFCDPDRAALRDVAKPTIQQLADALDAHLIEKQTINSSLPINVIRRAVLSECLTASSASHGFFSLNVPTGGGKTLASLAFALHHALAHGFRRIVVAIPFTSIIEQTADNYRRALGPLADMGLIEHHTNLDPKHHSRRHQLAVENWDAPLIVTTNVQLYESLFAAATTPCRKLHRLAGSIIILDEAQTLPVELLAPTLAALKELVAHYGCSVVLCTATQPALEYRAGTFDIGIPTPHRIIADERALFAALRRIQVTRLGKLADADLASRLADERSALCIVNTRPHAAKLYDLLVDRRGCDGCYHLSTFMCAQHRREVLAKIRLRLEAKLPCRVVSTQLIEAGVDVDFPAVYRAMAGFDSVAQAAGRCNREGLLETLGRVYVFDTEQLPPPGVLRAAAQCAAELAPAYPDPLHPDAIKAYFTHFYWHQSHHGWDKPDIMEALSIDPARRQLSLKFRQVARDYKIIRDEQNPILVPYNEEARSIRDAMLKGEIDFQLLRAAQKYTVGVRDNALKVLAENFTVVPNESFGLWILTNPAAYSQDKGLSPNVVGFDANMLIY